MVLKLLVGVTHVQHNLTEDFLGCLFLKKEENMNALGFVLRPE